MAKIVVKPCTLPHANNSWSFSSLIGRTFGESNNCPATESSKSAASDVLGLGPWKAIHYLIRCAGLKETSPCTVVAHCVFNKLFTYWLQSLLMSVAQRSQLPQDAQEIKELAIMHDETKPVLDTINAWGHCISWCSNLKLTMCLLRIVCLELVWSYRHWLVYPNVRCLRA